MAIELARIAIGAKDERRASLVTEVGKVMVEQRSLAHSRLGNQCQESSIAFRAIQERSERFPMLRSEVQEPGVRSHAERLLREFIEIENHAHSSRPPAAGWMRGPEPEERRPRPTEFG